MFHTVSDLYQFCLASLKSVTIEKWYVCVFIPQVYLKFMSYTSYQCYIIIKKKTNIKHKCTFLRHLNKFAIYDFLVGLTIMQSVTRQMGE